MTELWNQIADTGRNYIVHLIVPLTILVVGWLVALVLAWATRRLLRRTGLEERLAKALGDGKQPADLSRWAGRFVYYLTLLLVLVAFFQRVGLTMLTEPLNQLLVHVFDFAPRLIIAALMLGLAWILASGLRFVVGGLLRRLRTDERIGESAALEHGEGVSISENIATAVYWLVFLLFLPAVLSALKVEGLMVPVRDMMGEIMSFLPNIFGALLFFLVGWFAARIVQRVVTSLLAATTLDRVGRDAGIDGVIGDTSLSGLAGRVVYVLILVPAAIVSLDALDIRAISEPAMAMLATVFDVLPAIFTSALVLLLAYLAGRLLSGLTTELLTRAGFNSVLQRLGLGQEPAEGERTPSQVVGALVLGLVLLFAAIEAANLIGFATLGDLLTQMLTLTGRILLGIVIFGIGLALANLIAGVIRDRRVPQSGPVSMMARIAIITLSTAMALRHMGVANEIINLAFALILGAVAIAVALAFGLGARDAAAGEVDRWLTSLRGGKQD